MVQDEEPSTWSFTEFVQYQSLRFPHLTPLAELLTGQHSEPRWSFPWSRSQEVNVVVVDIEYSDQTPNPGLLCARHIRNIDDLRQEVLGTPDDLVVKLFLVEDMIAPIVDLLGSAFKCQPDFFWNHMLYKGVLWQEPVAEAGNNGGSRGSPIMDNTAFTSIRQRAYFSIPYRRYSEHDEGCARLRKQRTMFRSYNAQESVLEERVTGGMFTGSNGARVGILLFDSSLDEVFRGDQYNIFESIPQYDRKRALMPPIPLSTSMRDIFLQGLSSTSFRDNSENLGTTILRPLLSIIRNEWVQIIGNTSYHIARESVDVQWIEDYKLECMKSTQEVLAENLSMLQETVTLVHHGRIRESCQPRGSGTNHALRESYEEDFQDLISRTKECIVQNERNQGLINALTAIQDARNGLELTRQAVEESKRGIELSKRAINQAENIQALTSLATFYIPLSFVCSFFGMNVSPLTGQGPTSLWTFFIVAIPLTLVSLMIVYHWDRVLRNRRQWLHFVKGLIWRVSFFTRTRRDNNDTRDEEQNSVIAT